LSTESQRVAFHRRRVLAVTAVVIAALLGAFVTPGVATAAATERIVESFNGGASSWLRALGGVTPAGSSDATEGSSSLVMTYDLAQGSAELGKVATPTPWPTEALRSVKIDVKGDGSYNTLYLRLQDATGEVLYYRAGNLAEKSWSTLTVDLTRGPAAFTGGDANGRIDGSLSLYRLVVVRNGSEPVAGRIQVDNLRAVGDGWTGASANPRFFSAASESTTITVPVGSAGDFRLTVRDSSGHERVFEQTAASSRATIAWNGKTDDGEAFEGNISGELSHDTTPNGTVTNASTLGIPYLAGVSARTKAKASSTLAGVNSSMSTYDTMASADAEAKLMENAFVNYAREEFEWNRVEPRNGYFEWAKFDRAVAAAEARNIKIVGKLVYTADWASSAPASAAVADKRYYPPSDLNDWREYVRQTVDRYKGSVDTWEVWNEPNSDKYWKPSPSASGYAALLKAAHAEIKAVQPRSTVLIGGLANGFPESYVNALIAAGAGDSFDGLALHMYVSGSPEPSIIDTWFTGAETFMSRKLPGRTLWITEVGWTTCASCAVRVSEDLQAQYLSRFMLEASTRDVRGVMWFNLRESGNSTNSIDNYGLVQRDGRAKPAYTALARFGAATVQTVPIGVANPSPDGRTTVLSDMASTSGFKGQSLGTGGTTALSASTGRLGGAGALSVKYNYGADTATGGLIGTNIPVSGSPGALSLWAYGDNSNNPIFLKFTDATGEAFESKVGNLGRKVWQRMVFYIDGQNANLTNKGGDGDGKVDYPITVTQIHVYKAASSGVSSGQFILDDLSAHYGGIVRGAVFHGRGFITQAVYSVQPKDVNLAVPNSTAYIYDRGVVSGLSVSSKSAKVTLTSTPKYVVSAPEVSPLSGPRGTPVTLSLVTGDRSELTVQVYTQAGALIRTLSSGQALVSGPRAVAWNGLKSDGAPAAAGSYLFRVIAPGADGLKVSVTRPFTLR